MYKHRYSTKYPKLCLPTIFKPFYKVIYIEMCVNILKCYKTKLLLPPVQRSEYQYNSL